MYEEGDYRGAIPYFDYAYKNGCGDAAYYLAMLKMSLKAYDSEIHDLLDYAARNAESDRIRNNAKNVLSPRGANSA